MICALWTHWQARDEERNALTAVRRVLVVATIVVAAAATSIIVAGLSEGPPAGVAASPSAAASEPPVVESLPLPTIGAWDIPPADAVAPVGALAIPGIGMSDLADALMGAGYSCESFKASTDLLADAYVLSCTSAKGDAKSQVDAIYWTLEHVMTIHAAVSPITPGDEITESTAVEALLTPLLNIPFTGSKPSDQEAWFANQSKSAACEGDYCRQTFGEVRYEVEIGSGGALQLHIEGLAAEP